MENEIKINENITIRIANEKWAKEKYDSAMKSREQLLPWLPWVHFYDNQENGAEMMAKFQRSKVKEFEEKTNYCYDIFYDGQFAGSIEVMHVSEMNKKCEIGYWLDSDMTGKGIMTTCVKALTELLFDRLSMHRIAILAAPENAASCAVAERCGYEKEALLREDQVLEDKFYDTVIYAKLML